MVFYGTLAGSGGPGDVHVLVGRQEEIKIGGILAFAMMELTARSQKSVGTGAIVKSKEAEWSRKYSHGDVGAT